MAVHSGSAKGWFDTPCNPIVGVTMFVVGTLAILLCALYVAGQLLV